MKEFHNKTLQNQQTNMNGLIKGDLKKIENLARTVRPEDITVSKLNVMANSVNDLQRISNQIECELETYSMPATTRINLIIALVEAINNAQKHCYQFAPNKRVVINLFNIGHDYFLVGIESIGKPIPMDKIRRLLKENNPLKIGACNGRGYILMKNSVDVLYVSHYEFYTEVYLGIFMENEKKN
jgi:anti-sigma regulatory factor (Ser/Thr protein kinase)